MTLNANLFVLFALLLMILVGVVAAGAPQEPASRADHLPVRAALLGPALGPAGAAHFGALARYARPGLSRHPGNGRNRKAPFGALSFLQSVRTQSAALLSHSTLYWAPAPWASLAQRGLRKASICSSSIQGGLTISMPEPFMPQSAV